MKERQIAETIHASILETIGSTPLVALRKVTASCLATVAAKLEFLNPGGSVKDRVGRAIIEAYEASGCLQPGGTIVESTSGNTGVGLAMAAAVKGYNVVIVTKEKTSAEKVQMLEAYGARVVRTPNDLPPTHPDSYYRVAERIVAETPGAVLANQYHNLANPEVHYFTTGPEIWRATAGRITHFIAGLGTGGTISGTARYLKEQNPHIQIIGLDPVGSVYHDYFYTGEPEAFAPNRTKTSAAPNPIEGVGQDLLPSVVDFAVIDEVIQVEAKASLLMTQRLAREEGMLAGLSSGFAVAGALTVAQHLTVNDLVVVLLPDGGTRYLSKVFNAAWMAEQGCPAD